MADLPIPQMKQAADAIRALAMDAVQKADSGHPGTPMALADLAVVLWTQFLKHDPQRPQWADRDRFVLSCGHASMLLYALLHLSGYDLPIEELEQFRQWGSKTPGHPEYAHTAGVETTTGPLGQGITNAVGMALAEAHLAARFNTRGFGVVNHATYVIASDGDLMEGISHEAASLAGHLQLGKLIVLYDDNKISIDGSTDLAFTEDVAARFAAYGWHTQHVDGHDMQAVYDALVAARAESTRPSLIACRTIIGIGSPNRAGTAKAHGEPLGAAEIALVREAISWPHAPFVVPDDVYDFMRAAGQRGRAAYATWHDLFEQYIVEHPQLATQYVQAQKGDLPPNWAEALPSFPAGSKQATRNASGKVLAAIVPHVPTLVGGSADLTGSNKTFVSGMGHLQPGHYGERYISYGVREHGMAGIMNGMALHGGVRPYGGTFLVFSDYMRGAMRLSALMQQPVIYVLTHDSIGLGEDGPTHQPIEHLMALRAIPNMVVFRPADANETAAGWRVALTRQDGPTALVLTRQDLPTLDYDTTGALRGGYVLHDSGDPQAIILATGSEVEIALAGQALLAQEGIATRVVSLPSWELFRTQAAEYRAGVLPPHITARVSIEAGTTFGWAEHVGTFGVSIGLDHFGASAPYQTLYAQFGLTAEAVADAVRGLL